MNLKKSFRYFICLFLICFAYADVFAKDNSSDQKMIHFQEVPLFIKETRDEMELKIYVYDPADSALAPQELPFMNIEINYNEDGTIDDAELAELGRTDSFNGAQLIELVKYMQVLYGIPRLELTDAAQTLLCPKDGDLCQHEAIHKLSNIMVYLFGKGFYERGGALPHAEDDQNKVYKIATKHLHQTLRVDQFVKDLRAFGEITPKAANLADFIQKVVVATGSSETDLISEVFTRVRAQSNKDKAAHILWHQLLNRLVGMQDHFSLELSDYILSHHEQHPDAINQYCATTIMNYVNFTICLNESYIEDIETIREYFFDHQLEFLEAKLNDYLDDDEDEDDDDDDDDDEDNFSILAATFASRLNKEVLRNTFNLETVYIPNLREMYNRANAYQDRFQNDSSDDYSENLYGDRWMDLAQWIEDPSADEGKVGYVCLKWYVAKSIIDWFNIFEFIHPDHMEEKEAA